MVNADFQRTYHFEDSIIFGAGANRRKREDLLENATVVSIVDEHGNTSIVATLCVRPEVAEDDVSLAFGNINFLGMESDHLYFYVNNTNIGNFTFHDIVTNETVSNGTIIYGESGQIGGNITLPEGNYAFKIIVHTDENGMELFRIDVNATRQNATADIFCGEGFEIKSCDDQ
jgi:hypothetical protein